jgi:hypothetical protein
VIFAAPSDKEEWWMGLDDVINVAKRDMSFGLKLHELMTINKQEVGRDVPNILVRCIEFIDKHGKHGGRRIERVERKPRAGLDVEGLYRISGSSVDIENARAKFNKGQSVRFVRSSDVHLVRSERTVSAVRLYCCSFGPLSSGLLKLWLRDLREPLCTTGMFNSFINCVTDDAEPLDKSIEVRLLVIVLGGGVHVWYCVVNANTHAYTHSHAYADDRRAHGAAATVRALHAA